MNDWMNFFSDERMLSRESSRDDKSLWSYTSNKCIISSAHYHATTAGIEILSKGGNAVDASIAVSLALGVVEPAGSGIGGNGMVMLHIGSKGRTYAIEGPCLAPVNARPEAIRQSPRRYGYKAVAVPTNVAVMEYILTKYGTMTTQEVIAPAIKLAERGYKITSLHFGQTNNYLKRLSESTAAQFTLGPDKKPFPEGTLIKQPVLARTLRKMAENGFLDFYTGDIAKSIVGDMSENGGFICEEDLENIPWPLEKDPVEGNFGNLQVKTLPPPGGGETLLQMLELFDELEPDGFDPDSASAAVLFATIINRARLDRIKFRLGKTDKFGKELPERLSKENTEMIANELRKELEKDTETSHICVMDSEFNVVSLTQSIERSFGAKVATADLGFIYNGYMKAFKIENKNHPHYLKPRAPARSNASPTIAFQNQIPKIAVGSTGSERLNSGIFQVLVRLKSQVPFKAVSAPRLHCTPEREVLLEADRFPEEAKEALRVQGFTLNPLDPWSFKMGGLHLTIYDGESFSGVAEPRRDGAAFGL